MGGEGSGRKPSTETIIKRMSSPQVPVGNDMFIPNYSGVAQHDQTLTTLDSRYSLAGHNHDTEYLSLSGGTLNGNLTLSGTYDFTCDGVFPHFIWMEDSEIIYLGDSFESQIYFDGNDLILYNSATTKDIKMRFGSSKYALFDGSAAALDLYAGGAGLKVGNIGLAGSNPSSSYGILSTATSSTVAYNIYLTPTYTGGAVAAAACYFNMQGQGSSSSQTITGMDGTAKLATNPSGTITLYGAKISAGKNGATSISQGTHNYYGVHISPQANTTSSRHTNATVTQYGFYVAGDNWVNDSGTYNYYAGWIEGNEGLYFRDTALYINSDADGHLDLHADTSIDLNGTVNATGNMDVVGNFTAGTIQADNGYTGTFDYTNTVTVAGGVITGVA